METRGAFVFWRCHEAQAIAPSRWRASDADARPPAMNPRASVLASACLSFSLFACAGEVAEPAPESDEVAPAPAPAASDAELRLFLRLRCNKDLDAYGRPTNDDAECKDTNAGTFTLR